VNGEKQPEGWLPPDVREFLASEDRIAAVRDVTPYGPGADPDFDGLVALAASLFHAPVALLTLLDAEQQWFLARQGTDLTGTPAGISFCAHAVAARENVTVVRDATADPRFSNNPLVTGEQHVRFYAGAPLTVRGERVGTLCILDRVPRPEPDAALLENLVRLSALASSLFEFKEGTRSGAVARRALADEEKRRSVALAAASLSSWVWDVRADRIECDATLPPLFALPSATVLRPRDVLQAIDPRDLPQIQRLFRETLNGEQDYAGEYRVRGTEPTRWLAARGRVVERSASGRPQLVFGVNYDVTERKSAEQRQRLLLRELNHRVKNTLATVQALANQTVRHASEPRQFLEAFSARLQALGKAHSLLSDNEWRGISLAELVRLEVLVFADAGASRISTSGPDVLLDPDRAVGLALVLHELASNALIHGSLSVATGRLVLDWMVVGTPGDRRLDLSWTEGGGPSVREPAREGFGSILIKRSLAKTLSSEVVHEYRPGGVHARISLPLDS